MADDAARNGRQAHIAHAALIGLHAICCGMPALAVAAAALAGATSTVALFSDYVGFFHRVLHAHELWILMLSVVLVAIGGALELIARKQGRGRGFPWLYAISVGCFLINVAILAAHRV